jgi:hypothetical protein
MRLKGKHLSDDKIYVLWYDSDDSLIDGWSASGSDVNCVDDCAAANAINAAEM